jgi:hypothetical protein
VWRHCAAHLIANHSQELAIFEISVGSHLGEVEDNFKDGGE